MGKDLRGVEIGSGYTQRKDGAYTYRYMDKYSKRVSLYNRSLDALRKEVESLNSTPGPSARSGVILDDWHKDWMDVYKYEVRDSTRLQYNTVYDKHIHPVFGNFDISEITTLEVRRFLNNMKKAGYSFEVRNKARIVLLDMFDKAILDDMVFKNPVRGIKFKRDEKVERRVLTREEQTDFFATCKGTFYEELFTVAVLTGLRPGELFALRWQDIDLKTNTLHVSRTLLYQKLEGDTGKTFHIHPPKTETSDRIVSFSDRCALALKSQFKKKSNVALKETSRPLPGLEDLLFVTKFNTPLNSVLYSSAIDRIVEMINESRCALDAFETFSGHTFRHTYATRCFEADVSPKVVQKQLGHASIKMTMDLYTHLLDDTRDSELEKFTTYSEDVFNDSDFLKERRFNEALHPKVVHL